MDAREGRAAIVSGLPEPVAAFQEPQAPPRKSASGHLLY